tara:strand:+ start:252 stop:545 length:294 start_codon:yes stop_codon:yes gene_type:complete
MKTPFLKILKSAPIFGILLFASCQSEECAHCHVAVEINGTEYELKELGEYCDDKLKDVEAKGYTLTESISVDADGNALPNAVGPNDAVEVHCGEDDH